MARVNDVAIYILQQLGPVTAMKLQKLVYYAQAWHLVWDEEPLFEEIVEAWPSGPVVGELFSQHKGKYLVGQGDFEGNAGNLTQAECASVDAVLETYGGYSATDLSHMAHSETPWIEARRGLDSLARSENPISLDSMMEFYTALYVANISKEK